MPFLAAEEGVREMQLATAGKAAGGRAISAASSG